MKNIINTLVILFSLNSVFAQDSAFLVFDTNANGLEIDNLGNIYLINSNVVTKYDANMNFLCAYDNYPAGSMSSIDTHNPFKVIVFYSEYNKLIYLDSKLSELYSPIFLEDAKLYNTKVVCSSSFGGFWVFDEQNVCVRRVSSNLEISQQGTNIYDKLGEANVIAMRESISYLFLLTDDGKFLILDKFGNFYKVIDIGEPCSDFCIDNDMLYYSKNGEIFAYDIMEDKIVTIPSDGKADKFRIRHDLLYMLIDNKLKCSKILIE